MSLLQRIALCSVLALSGLAPGDRPAAPGRVVAGLAATEREDGFGPSPSSAGRAAPAAVASAGSRFVTFGWVSPPASVTTAARIAEMDSAGLTLLMPAWNDSGAREQNLARLDWAAARGLRCLIWDARFDRFEALEPGSAEGETLLDSIAADYRDHPAFFGYYLGDEPPRSIWPLLQRIAAPLRQRDPLHPAWNNLWGRASFDTREGWQRYTRDYVAALGPAVLCNDEYDFELGGDRALFVENAAGLAAMAREAGLPFWSIVLLVEHGPFRAVTPAELAWQTSMLLAYGARGVGYFTYWTPDPDPVWNWHPAVIDHEGERTAWYPVLAALNRRVRPAGEILASLTWLATTHAGSVPPGGTPFAPDSLIATVEGRAALGNFVDAAGTRYLLVANADSQAARRVTLTLSGSAHPRQLGERAGEWRPVAIAPGPSGGRVRLDLAPGGFALLRFEDRFRPVAAGRRPALAISPCPARGEVRLAVPGLGAGGHVEILDAAGRRVRAWRAATGTIVWRGERDAGGLAAPGFFFVRAEDAGGVAVSRLQWLGR